MQAHTPVSTVLTQIGESFKLLLFIDKRPISTEQIRLIRQQLKELSESEDISLDIVDVSNQPYLAEHFKLVATPALIKISADTHQVLTGTDIASQIAHWWSRWLNESHAAKKKVTGLEPIDSDVDTEDLSKATGQANNGHRTSTLAVNAVAQSTEILRLSDEIFKLKQDKENLAAQVAFKDRIIAMMAHDLRNPLTAASMALETLELAYEPDSAKSKKFTPKLTAHLVQMTKAQIRTINSMIAEILQAARGSSAEIQVSPQKMDVQSLCYTVIESFQSKLEHKKQTLDTDIPQDLPAVYADPDQVQRVLTNLIDNAAKYTSANGQIGIIALHRTTEKVQISIRDTGPGIPKDKQKSIFEENYRLKRDQEEDGYGLGLALCQQIVRAHYGQIWVDSKRGEGSCFHFTLPVYRG